tara:strand:+ start:2549 stop:4462 length:1914 start_codon:yes stop_codon:yes gene_type:complete
MAERRIDKYNETYNNFIVIWDKWIKEADSDMRFVLGDQWSSAEKGYLKSKRRNAFVFNKIKRIIKIISGYQRKNRLSYKVDPNENSDTEDASIWSQTLQYIMKHCQGYNVMSDAFEQGALKTGLNLVEPWLDFSTDPLNGELKYTRIPHNRFLLHPSFTRRDLSDCPEILRREWITKSAAKSIAPFFAGEIDKLKPMRPAQDNKYITSNFNENLLKHELLRYDEHWQRVSKPVIVFFDVNTNRMHRFDGTEKEANDISKEFPSLEKIKRFERDVEVTIFIEDEEIYHGPDPMGTNNFRFVPVMGYFDPEYIELDKKIQGVVRDIIDPQREVNKRRSKNLDILDSQLNSGYFAEEKSVVNKESLYQTGQGGVIWLKQQAGRPISERVAKITPPDIPAGNLQMQKVMDDDLVEISGANNELLGLADKDDVEVAGILARVRTGQALTTLQDLFDNYSTSKELLGRITMAIVRKNWDAEKIHRITNRQPSAQFFDPDLSRHDVEVTEGLLTDSQKQMHFMQLLGMKRAGVKIPDSAIIQASNLERKDELAKIVEGQAKMATQSQQIQDQVNQAAIESTKAKAFKDASTVEVNKSKANLNEILGIKAASEIEINKVATAMSIAKEIDEITKPEEQKQLVTQR